MSRQIRIGINSFAYRWSILDGKMDIISFLNQAVSLGVEIAQICDNFNLLELSIDDAVRIVRDFGKRISIQTGFRGHDVKMLEKAILVTNALGGSQMRLIPENTDDKSDVDCIGNDLLSIVPLCRECNINVMIENHFAFKPQTYSCLVKTLPSDCFSICFDCFNSIARNVDSLSAMHELAPYVRQIHVKDARICREGTGFKFNGCLLGDGVLDLDSLVDCIPGNSNPLDFVLESWMDRDFLGKDVYSKEISMNEKGIEWLRRYINE